MLTQRKKRSRLVLVIGGASSGKSEAAMTLAGSRGPRAFVATGQGLDEEMAARIARHQATRSSDWETIEEPLDVDVWFAKRGAQYRTILFDCVTLWLSNLIGVKQKEAAIYARVEALLRAIRTTSARVVIVTNELGLGLVPATKSTRAFREVAGRVNQQIAVAADEVHMVLSGISFRLK